MHPDVPLLSGKYIDSFAYKTIKDRMPAILGRVVDDLAQIMHHDVANNKEQIEKIQTIISKIGELRHNMTRNKQLPLLEDEYWKDLLLGIPLESRTWFDAPWLIVECLMYKLLHDIAVSCKMKGQDPLDLFQRQKQKSMESSTKSMHILAEFLECKESEKDLLLKVLEFSLWGNQHDLSLKVDKSNSRTLSHILVNDSDKLVSKLETCKHICIVLDNSGFELFGDFCLALVLSRHECRVTFHLKEYPWFVSDTTLADVKHLIDFCNSDSKLASLGQQFKSKLESGEWTLKSDPFWTTGNAFWDLPSLAPALFAELKNYDLALFKGDLNYRKIVYDASWPVTTLFKDAIGPLDGQFNMALLRTVKSETCVGLSQDTKTRVQTEDVDWMVNGLWGIIQYHPLS